jgi:predicted RNA-binding Zn ribbon-like protein
MPLLLVQSFVNTWEGDSGEDLLADPGSAAEWLSAAGLLHSRRGLDERDLATIRAAREGIRALLVENGGGPAPDVSLLEPLDVLARSTRFRASVDATGLLEIEEEVDDAPIACGRLFMIIRDAQRDGTWTRLKACHNSECLWAFYDRSHAGRGAWCDMAACGNRIKNRNLRSRHKNRVSSNG